MKQAFRKTPPEILHAHHVDMTGKVRVDRHPIDAPLTARVYAPFKTGYGEGARAARARRRMAAWAEIAAQLPEPTKKMAETLKRLGYTR